MKSKTRITIDDMDGIWYSAFALALFKTRQTGKNLDRIPVEWVGKTIAWLKKQCSYFICNIANVLEFCKQFPFVLNNRAY